MQTDASPSVDYLCLDCETAAEAHEVHPFFDVPSWREGFARGYEEGRLDGERVGEQRLRSDLLEHLQVLAWDVRLDLQADLETPLGVIRAVARFVEDRRKP